MKSTLFRVLANHLICASQILLLVYTLYDGFQDDFQIATLGAALGSVFFLLSAGILLLPQSGEPFKQAYVFSAWSALLGSMAFLAASVGIMHSQAGTAWSVLLFVGFVATSGGALLVIADSHIYATDPAAFLEPGQMFFEQKYYMSIGALLFIVGSITVFASSAVHLAADPSLWRSLICELASRLIFAVAMGLFFAHSLARLRGSANTEGWRLLQTGAGGVWLEGYS